MLRALVAFTLLLALAEPAVAAAPIVPAQPTRWWEDFRLVQIIATATLAFLGFTFGTWVKYWFDRRRDDRLCKADRGALAAAFLGELQYIWHSHQAVKVSLSKPTEEASRDVAKRRGLGRLRAYESALSGAPDLVYRSAATRLGLLGSKLSYKVTRIYAFHESVLKRIERTIVAIEQLRADESVDEERKTSDTQELVQSVEKHVADVISVRGKTEFEAVLKDLEEVQSDPPPGRWQRLWQRFTPSAKD